MKNLGIDKNGRLLDDTLINFDEISISPYEYGFPISEKVWSIMNEHKLFLGRTVRNASTVNLKSDKIRLTFHEGVATLYYRAVI
jgi:hypothetical protein